MQNRQNSTGKKGIALPFWCILIAAILTLIGTASAQQLEEKSKQKPVPTPVIDSLYTRALEDTLILYEQLKPAFKFLEISYQFKNEECQSLRSEVRILHEMQSMQKDQFDRSIAREKQKGKKRLRVGTALGLAIALLFSAF